MGSAFFFFVKQKTAYEMRISDWSADVCSSDLAPVVVQAAIAIPRDDSVLSTAAAACEQPGQQEGRPTQTVNALCPCFPHTDGRRLELLRKFGLPVLRRTPEGVVDNAQLRDIRSDPFGLGVRPRDAPASAGVLHIAMPVPHEHTGIKLVVEDAGTARDMSADRRIAPSLAKRTGNRFTVQVSRDRPRAPSGRELTEDAAHDQRFGLVDRALPAERLALDRKSTRLNSSH